MQVPASKAVDSSAAADTIAGDFAAYLGTTSPWVTVSPSASGPTLALSLSALFPANAPFADARSLEVNGDCPLAGVSHVQRIETPIASAALSQLPCMQRACDRLLSSQWGSLVPTCFSALGLRRRPSWRMASAPRPPVCSRGSAPSLAPSPSLACRPLSRCARLKPFQPLQAQVCPDRGFGGHKLAACAQHHMHLTPLLRCACLLVKCSSRCSPDAPDLAPRSCSTAPLRSPLPCLR